MTNKPNLRLIDCKHLQKKKNLFKRFWNWINKPRTFVIMISKYSTTEEEKREVIRNFMTQKFAEYQLTSQSPNLYPLMEAINYVNKLSDEGRIDEVYKQIKCRKGA